MKMFEQIGEFIPDSLIVSADFPILKKGVGLKQGQKVLKRGSLIVKNDDGEYVIAPQKETLTKGSIFGILADDTDTGESGESTVPAICYITGVFNPDAVTVAEDATVSDYEEDMRSLSMFLDAVQPYGGTPGE